MSNIFGIECILFKNSNKTQVIYYKKGWKRQFYELFEYDGSPKERRISRGKY